MRNAETLESSCKTNQAIFNDLQYTRDNGYIKGITNIFVKNLCEMPATSRPIHCSDKKNLQFYVKDENKGRRTVKTRKLTKA